MAENETAPPAVSVASKMDEDSSDAEPLPPRENMISNAVRFLLNPKVRESPFSQRKAFLAQKGLTSQEIDIAVERSGTAGDANMSQPAAGSPNHSSPAVMAAAAPVTAISPWAKWRDRTATMIILSGVSYGLYQLIKKYLLSLWLGPSEEERRTKALQARIQELETSVSTAVSSLSDIQKSFTDQQEQLRQVVLNTAMGRGPSELERMQQHQGVSEIKTEIQSLKGLLLSRKQFPPTPRTTPVIPAWQLGNSQSTSDSDTAAIKVVDAKAASVDTSPASTDASPTQAKVDTSTASTDTPSPTQAKVDTSPASTDTPSPTQAKVDTSPVFTDTPSPTPSVQTEECNKQIEVPPIEVAMKEEKAHSSTDGEADSALMNGISADCAAGDIATVTTPPLDTS